VAVEQEVLPVVLEHQEQTIQVAVVAVLISPIMSAVTAAQVL
jgi:hypothetical protein